MKSNLPTLLACLPALLIGSLQAIANPIYPSSDLRVQDATGNGFGDHSHADDATHEVLNLGDNTENHTWRSVIKFDLEPESEAIRNAETVQLQLTVRNRLLEAPREWTFEVIHFPSKFPFSVLYSSTGHGTDEYSAAGNRIYTDPAGALRQGMQMQIDVTEAVKNSLDSGVFAIRLQLNPDTNHDNVADQLSFFAGSHEVNAPHLRPQLILQP